MRVYFSHYGQSVNFAYDVLLKEADADKMRVFLSDVIFDQERTAGGKRVPVPLGKGAARHSGRSRPPRKQSRSSHLALQVLGDPCGLGTNYFDLNNVGYARTATEIPSDNSALMMHSIRKS